MGSAQSHGGTTDSAADVAALESCGRPQASETLVTQVDAHSLEGWWEHSSDAIGLVLVRDGYAYVHGIRQPGKLHVSSSGSLRFGSYLGTIDVMTTGTRKTETSLIISWQKSPTHSKWTWKRIAEHLPEAFDPVTQEGRWKYEALIGSGGYGNVYMATDATEALKGKIAIKVSKFEAPFTTEGIREVFRLHREFEWSKHCLHNEKHPKHRRGMADLFARCLEDHTGLQPSPCFVAEGQLEPSPEEEEECIRAAPSLPRQPYIVMELLLGQTLWVAQGLGGNMSKARCPELSKEEKRSILQQATTAVEY